MSLEDLNSTMVTDGLEAAEPVFPDVNMTIVTNGTIKKEITFDQAEMLEALSRIPELRVKSQQISEADLSKEQKLDVLKEIFSSHPMQFLTRFGEHLEPSQLKCFDEFKEDENVLFYMKHLERNISSDAKKLRAKNRRYAALQNLVDTTDYFTEEIMQRRNPILFDQLIGRYHTKEERSAFLARSEQIASTSSTTPLTDLLMAHLDRNEEGQSYRRLDQEQQKADEDEADDEYLDRMDQDSDEDEPGPRRNGGVKDTEEGEEIEDEEKELLKEEFFTTMYRDFLEGRDVDFDYSTVDNNEEYDVGENLEQDEEEKYFGDEEPLEIHSESNSEADDLFKPPVRSSDIEAKIQTLTVTNGAGNNYPSISQASVQSMPCDIEDEEDELDAYMRQVEKELQNK